MSKSISSGCIHGSDGSAAILGIMGAEICFAYGAVVVRVVAAVHQVGIETGAAAPPK